MDCKDVSSSIQTKTGGRQDFSLLVLFTHWQLHCLEKIQNELRREFPRDQEKILFDEINDHVKKLKQDLILLDVEDLQFIRLSLANYNVGGDADYNKFLIKSLLSSYDSISKKVVAKEPAWKDRQLLETWKKDVQSLKKDSEINISLDSITKAEFEKYLKVVRDVNSLYAIYSTIESSKEFFVGEKIASIDEKKLVLQKIFHDIGEYTKGTEDTPNLSPDVRKDLEKMGILLDPLNKFRNLLAHQLFPVVEFNDVEIKDLFNKGFLSIKAIIESKISNIERTFIKSIIPQDGLQIDGRSLGSELIESERMNGVKGLIEHVDLIRSLQQYKSFPEDVQKSINEIYENARRMKSKNFPSDVGSLTIDREKEISNSITKYVEEVNNKLAKQNELKEYSNLFDKLVSLSREEDRAILGNANTDLLEIRKAIDSLRSETRDSLNGISNDFLNKNVFEKIEVRRDQDGNSVFLKGELQKYFDAESFKGKLPLVEFKSSKKFEELLEGVPERDKSRKELLKILKLNLKKVETDKIGSPEPDVYEKIVHGLNGISEENKKQLLSYSLKLKKEKCLKLLEVNLPALNKIYYSIVNDRFIPREVYDGFDFQYEQKQTMNDKVKSFYLNELVMQIKELEKLNIPYAIQSCIVNIYSTWEKAKRVLGLQVESFYLRKLRNYFSHGDILISGQGGKVLAEQLVELKTKIADIDFSIEMESFGSNFDSVLSHFESGPIGEVLSSVFSNEKGTLDLCLQGGHRNKRRARSITECFFSKDDVEKFSKGKVDENNVDKVIIDSEKFLTYVKSSQDELKNDQLIKFIENKSVEGEYRYLVDRVIQDQGYERFIHNELIMDLYGDISQQNVGLIKGSKLKDRFINAAGRMQLMLAIQGTVASCAKGRAIDCGLSVGGMSWSLVSHPIDNVIVKVIPKTIESAGRFAGHFAGKLIPGTLGKQVQFGIKIAKVNIGTKLAKGVAGTVGGIFDIVDVSMSASNLINCKKRENSDNPCGEQEIRDNIASISFAGASFIFGIALLSMPVANIVVGLSIFIAQGIYGGISNIIEYEKKYDTTHDENFRIFLNSIVFLPTPYDVERLSTRSNLVDIQAENAWKALRASPANVVAYGIGFGSDSGIMSILPGHGRIFMNRTDANTTNLSRVIPKLIHDDAEMICLPQYTEKIYEKGLRRSVPTAVHYCENAMVVADKRRMQNGTQILYNLENIIGTVVGSNTLNNDFLIFDKSFIIIYGGCNTINRFILLKRARFLSLILCKDNATNIIDQSQLRENDKPEEVEINYDSNGAFDLKINDVLVAYGTADTKVDTSSYYYIGRQKIVDKVYCSDYRLIAENVNSSTIIDGNGGLNKDQMDIVYNCQKVAILPYTKVTGKKQDYTFFVKTTGYRAKDLYSEIDVNGIGTIIFPEIDLLNDCSEFAYSSNDNTLSLKIEQGQNNHYVLDIQNYINRSSGHPNFVLIDKNGSNVVPKIGRVASIVEIIDSFVEKVDSFEVHSEHSLDNFDVAEKYYKKILGNNKGYKVFGVVREKLQNQSNSTLQCMVFGSSASDIISFDQSMFARGGNGSDVYVVESNTEKREIIIDNNSDDKMLDSLMMPEVPQQLLVQQCNLYLTFNNTRIQVSNYLRGYNYRHFMVTDSKGQTFIPYLKSMLCLGSSEESGKLVPFFHATPTQNMFLLTKDFQYNHVVINSRLEEIERYKDKDNLLLLRGGEVPFIIKIESFYNDRGKWEDVNFLLWDDGNFSPYPRLYQDVNGLMDYQDKLESDYRESVKEYVIDFTQSVNITHNQDNTLSSVGQDEERIGIMILKNITPDRIKVSSSSRDLVFSDKVSKHEINIKNWSDCASCRISTLEFDLGLEPIVIQRLDWFSLFEVEAIRDLLNESLLAFQKKLGFETKIEARTSEGRAPLHYAAENGNLERVKQLIEEELSDINAKDRSRKTPLHYAAQNGHLNVVEMLIEKYAAVVDVTDNEGAAPLHYAALNGHLNVVEKLIEKGANVHSIDKILRTPLCYAAQNGHLNVVQKLIEKLAYFDVIDDNFRTPLHYAAQNGHLNVVEKLIEMGADVNAIDIYSQAPVQYAAQNGHLNVVEKLIEKLAYFDVIDDKLRTPLHYAAQNGHLNVVRKLIEKGAEVNANDINSYTPLHYAAKNGRSEVVKYLVEQKHININVENRYGQTPLSLAIEGGYSDIVGYLKKKINQRKETFKQRNRRHHNGDHARHHMSNKPLAIDSSNQPEIAVSSGARPSSWINDLFGWVKSSVGGLYFSGAVLPEKTLNTTSSISQVDAQIDVNVTIMLLDVVIRKVTGQKYISSVDQPVPLLEATGYALNITDEFEKVVGQAAKDSKLSIHRLDINFIKVQEEVTRKIIAGKFDEISEVLKSHIEKACPGREAGKLGSKKFDKFMTTFNNKLDIALNQPIQQMLHNGNNVSKIDNIKEQQNLGLSGPRTRLDNILIAGNELEISFNKF